MQKRQLQTVQSLKETKTESRDIAYEPVKPKNFVRSTSPRRKKNTFDKPTTEKTNLNRSIRHASSSLETQALVSLRKYESSDREIALCSSGSTAEEFIPKLSELWGVPRESIIDYIRLSVLPSSWSASMPWVAQWHLSSEGGKVQAAAKSSVLLSQTAKEFTNLIPDSSSTLTKSGYESRRIRRLPEKEEAPREISMGNRIERFLQELRSDPTKLEQFRKRVQKQQKERASNSGDHIERNKAEASSRLAKDELDARQKSIDEHRKAVKTNRDRIEHKIRKDRIDAIERRNKHQLIQQELFERKRVSTWLPIVFQAHLWTHWHKHLLQMRSLRALREKKAQAAATIQSMWRKALAKKNERMLLNLFVKIKRMMWGPIFRARCRIKGHRAVILRLFLTKSLRESQDRTFKITMMRWRYRVIRTQQYSRDYLACTDARVHALTIWWNKEYRKKLSRKKSPTKGQQSRTNRPPTTGSEKPQQKNQNREIDSAALRTVIVEYLLQQRQMFRNESFQNARRGSIFARELKADDAKLLLSTPSGWQSIMRETELAVKSVPTFYLYSNLNSTVFQTLTKSLNDTFTDDALRKTPVAANQSIRRV